MSPAHTILRLTLLPGVGPILGRRLLERFGSSERIFQASAAELASVHRLGDVKARVIHAAIPASEQQLHEELTLAEKLGASFLAFTDPGYPALLREIPDAPLILSYVGDARALAHAYPAAIVGSRSATAYGIEQAERFAAALAEAGLSIVSGGARGIDSAAHRAALRVGGVTVAVLGCGLAHRYPPENAKLFDQIASHGGAVVSELPLSALPAPENFPVRNRIVSGLSLGTLVIEAPKASGALITARLAAEDHGREVMAIPGRIDSRASEGCLELIKSGSAAMVTTPQDVIDLLESPARHRHAGTHEARFAPLAPAPTGPESRAHEDGHLDLETTAPVGSDSLFQSSNLSGDGSGRRPSKTEPGLLNSKPSSGSSIRSSESAAQSQLTGFQQQLVAALVEPKSVDDLVATLGVEAGSLRADLTILELRGVIRREGSKLIRQARQ
ncbi:MAG TPA: DNA-processing protein DprA [Phycisphaerales bacterium]|nr:DNA-processing protein DprA [Phycisphaerales bacterium]